MIHIRCDSTVYELLTFFAYVGEFPYAAIPLLGGYDTNRKVIYGVPEDLKEECRQRLPADMLEVLTRFVRITDA